MTGALLEARDVVAGYGDNVVLEGASLELRAGEVLGLIGHNGAGKTTLLKALYGLLPVSGGRVLHEGEEITRARPEDHLRRGIGYVPQERNVFANLSVVENLELGASALLRSREHARTLRERQEYVFGLFPQLRERQRQAAGSMSGGEQRMVAIGIGLMLKPRVLLLDEPTTGLAPIFVEKLMDAVRLLNGEEGVSVLIVEQNIVSMLRLVNRVYVLKKGRTFPIDRPKDAIDGREIWKVL